MILLICITIAILAAMLAEFDAPTLAKGGRYVASEPTRGIHHTCRVATYRLNETHEARHTGSGPPKRGEEEWVLWTIGIRRIADVKAHGPDPLARRTAGVGE